MGKRKMSMVIEVKVSDVGTIMLSAGVGIAFNYE
jgi:hypothetical protein